MKEFIVFIVYISIFVSQGKQLPSYIEKCKLNDPGLDKCLKKNLLDFQERLRKNIKELKLPSLDPYVLPQAYMETSWMNTTLTNLRLYGSNVFDVNYVKFDIKEGIIWLNLTTPYIYIISDYEMDGKLLQFVLHGQGEMEIKQNSTVGQIKMYGTRTMKNGKEYLSLMKIDYKIVDYKGTYMYVHDLFKNNPELTERINSVIATNIDELSKDVIPLAEKLISTITLSFFKGVFDAFSLDELFD